MFKRFLVPLDGSTFSEQALPRALDMASRVDGSIHLVTVANRARGNFKAEERSPGESQDRDRLVEQAEEYLERVRARLISRAGSVEVTRKALSAGNVTSGLLREMGEDSTDLVVMTTHGRGPLARAWLGSVADALVRRTQRPILLIRPEEELAGSEDEGFMERVVPPIQHILVPLDGSKVAEEALEHARAVATMEKAGLILARVVAPISGGAYPYVTVPAREEEATDEARREAREALEEVAEGLREDGLLVETAVAVRSEIAGAIVDMVTEHGVDLVAMSTRGQGRVARLFLGSVADKVIRTSPVPVLVHCPVAAEDE